VAPSGREFLDIYRNERFMMEAGGDDAEILQVGKYSFSKAGFERAKKVIREGFQGNDWLVIDEIGPLELKDGGFADVLKEALKLPGKNLLLVVRQGLVEDVVKKFGIMSFETIIKPPTLNS
jgi:nucleoside-triphosphatase THEP1